MLHDNSSRSSDWDSEPLVSRAHADTEDFDMQVMLDDGQFHREMDYTTTACELPIPHVGMWRRIQKYEGNLCVNGCYSAPELRRAKEANEKLTQERHDEETTRFVRTDERERDRKVDEWMEGVKNADKPKRR